MIMCDNEYIERKHIRTQKGRNNMNAIFNEIDGLYTYENLPAPVMTQACDLKVGNRVAFTSMPFTYRPVGQIHEIEFAPMGATCAVLVTTNAGTFELWGDEWVVVYDPYADERRAQEIDALIEARNHAIGAFFATVVFCAYDGSNVQVTAENFNAIDAAWRAETGATQYVGVITRPHVYASALEEALVDMQSTRIASQWATACFDSISWVTYCEIMEREQDASLAFMQEDMHAFGYYG